MVEPRSARVLALGPSLAFKRENFLLLDPEAPLADPNELLAKQGGRLDDPRTMNHNCPSCGRTMTWDLFRAHALPCYRKWRRVKLDITKRVFQGGGPADA